MSFQSRKQKILKIIGDAGEAEVSDLAAALGTSEITIRRDLALLASDGLLQRTHGGAIRVGLGEFPVSFANKSAVNAEEKDYICRLAAAEIRDGEVIFIDCGSTAFRLCPFIRSKKIKVITNSLPVVNELAGAEISVTLVGGEVDRDRLAVHGSMAVEHIRRYRADKAFLGVDGISAVNGLSAMSEKEAEITLAMAGQASEVYLLCDSAKLGKEKYLQFAPLSLADVLITNAGEDAVRAFREAGMKVINEKAPV